MIYFYKISKKKLRKKLIEHDLTHIIVRILENVYLNGVDIFCYAVLSTSDKNLVATSAHSEEYFRELKNLIFHNQSNRIDKFIILHLRSLAGTTKLLNASNSPTQHKSKPDNSNLVTAEKRIFLIAIPAFSTNQMIMKITTYKLNMKNLFHLTCQNMQIF